MIVHLNGRLLPLEQAAISPLDRGFIFGDGVYEGLRSFRGRVVAMDPHIRRMRSALEETRIDWDPEQLHQLTGQLLEANETPDAFIYWQVTRGTPAPGQPVRTRTPAGPMAPTVFGFCSAQPPLEHYTSPPTVTAAIRPDTRWHRGHLKSTSLLGNILAAIEGQEQGAGDVILVRDGFVAEGSATNAILALPDSSGRTQLVTPSLDSASILAGITRALVLQSAPAVIARPVRVEELFRASEIMLVGSTSMVTAVTHLDGKPIGDGTPGPAARQLLNILVQTIRAEHELSQPRTTLNGCGCSPSKADASCTSSQTVA